MGTWSAARRSTRRVWRTGYGLGVGDLLPRAEKKNPERFGGGRVTSTFALDLRWLGERLGSMCHKTTRREERSRCVPDGAVGNGAAPEEAHADVACARGNFYPPQALPCPVRAHGFGRQQPSPGRIGRGNRPKPYYLWAAPMHCSCLRIFEASRNTLTLFTVGATLPTDAGEHSFSDVG